MRYADLSQLNEKHKLRPDCGDAMLIRYDLSVDYEGDPVVYAFLEGKDILKLDHEDLESLRHSDEGLSSFFLSDGEVLRFYIDTGRIPDFKLILSHAAEASLVKLIEAFGDLRYMCDESGDFLPAQLPCFLIAGFEFVDFDDAVYALKSHESTVDKENDHGDSGFEPS